MKKIFYALLVLLPISLSYAGSKDKINMNKSEEIVTNTNNFKYRFVKVWANTPPKELVEILKINDYSIPSDSAIFSDVTISDSSYAQRSHTPNTVTQRGLGHTTVNLKTEYNVIEENTNFSYGKVVNKDCFTFSAVLNTQEYNAFLNSNLRAITDSQLYIEDHYVEPTNIQNCSNNPLMKTGIKYDMAVINEELKLKVNYDESLIMDKNLPFVKVLNISNKEKLMFIAPNIFRKDKNGKISYLNYFFYISVEDSQLEKNTTK
jgi:hypothetical protein